MGEGPRQPWSRELPGLGACRFEATSRVSLDVDRRRTGSDASADELQVKSAGFAELRIGRVLAVHFDDVTGKKARIYVPVGLWDHRPSEFPVAETDAVTSLFGAVEDEIEEGETQAFVGAKVSLPSIPSIPAPPFAVPSAPPFAVPSTPSVPFAAPSLSSLAASRPTVPVPAPSTPSSFLPMVMPIGEDSLPPEDEVRLSIFYRGETRTLAFDPGAWGRYGAVGAVTFATILVAAFHLADYVPRSEAQMPSEVSRLDIPEAPPPIVNKGSEGKSSEGPKAPPAPVLDAGAPFAPRR
jgi:hypothetical protein